MPRYLILARSDVTAKALNAWLELLGEKSADKAVDDSRRIVWDRAASSTGTVDAYEWLVERVEIAARAGDDRVPLNQVVALVDTVRPFGLNAVEESGNWENLVAMLILTFPEIRWVFGLAVGDNKESGFPNHDLPSLLNRTRRDPLLDPTGLREHVRTCTNEGLKGFDDLRLRVRQLKAAAIDEEKPYAYLHGYTAYRFGCRADVVTTWALMKERFGVKETSHGYWLLMEDMSLNFPDRPNSIHLLQLEEKDENGKSTGRAYHCPQLDSEECNIETSAHRILVTTGQTRPRDTAFQRNHAYLRRKKRSFGRGDTVLKPVSGMFDFWEKAGLLRRRKGARRLGDVDESDSLQAEEPGKFGGHGAPGKLMLVAETLIRRAESLLGKVESVDEAVQGAVLATDALELTGGRTPTTAIEALSLKHQFEVLAECQFSGVEYHIKVEPRINEIAVETEAICWWFHKNQRESASLNAQMHILNQIVRILREHNQFDEEQVCMYRVRRLHTTLWMRERSWRYVFWPIIRYVELLLGSFLGFVGVVFIWLVVLSLLFTLAGSGTQGSGAERWLIGLENAVTSFFSVGPPMQHGPISMEPSGWYVLVSSLAMVSSFLHLGVLISHLYTIVSRR